MRFTRWDQEETTEFSNEVLLLLSDWHIRQCEHCEDVDEIALLLWERDYFGLCHYELKPTMPVETYRHLRQILAFFQKRKDLDIGIDVTEVARQKFIESETKCRETNEIFRLRSLGGFCFTQRVESVLYVAQRKISAILGDLPSLEDIKLRFGPGATTQVKKKDASVRRKLSQVFCASDDAIRFLPELLAEMPLWSQVSPDGQAVSHTVVLEDERMDFARKNAKTDRTIGIGPALNSIVQLGIGDVMSDRLGHCGIDLRDQTINQRLARLGSIDGSVATVDLSSASDLNACGLVEDLLPYEWWDFLRAFRTENIATTHGLIRQQKFSAMGNGFTFPLETLIFFAIAKACEEVSGFRGPVNVYGDDIVVPVGAIPLLFETLTACGHTVNKAKSYWTGDFRESCGKDYYSGIDVRPCYIKASLSGSTCFVLHNFYVRNMQPEPAALVLEVLDVSLRLWGPDGFGDGHLLGEYDLKPHRRNAGWGGFTFESYTYKNPKRFYRLGADYVYPSYSIYMSGPDFRVEPAERFFRRPWKSDFSSLPRAVGRAGHYRRFSALGSFRPDNAQSRYKWNAERKRMELEDSLPGVDGYKRIKIYVLG